MPVPNDAPLEPGLSPANATPAARAPLLDKAAPAAGHEIGGPARPEPTRYGDWEQRGRCIDF
ncbi:MAG: succinate dehydrogenase assembly factor 4 [Steroidobacteraceae bacterium]